MSNGGLKMRTSMKNAFAQFKKLICGMRKNDSLWLMGETKV